LHKEKVFFELLLILILVFIFFVIGVYFFEKKANPQCQDFFDAFRIVFVYFFGEYIDFTPKTIFGKIVSILAFLIGIFIVAALIGKFASYFISIKREGKMPQILENHIVICNWNEKGVFLVKEIHTANPDIPICILTDKKDEETRQHELEIRKEFLNTFFKKGDPTLHINLKNLAFAHTAKSVIILADERCPDPDGKTALIGLAITKLEKNLPRKPHIIAEIINHQKIDHLRDAGVDEYICASHYGVSLMAQAALYPKLSDVYHQLLTYSEDTCEVYLIEEKQIPEEFYNKSFKQIAQRLNELRENNNNPVILIGIKRGERFILNPKSEKEFDFLKKGDALIVLAYTFPQKIL